jgi:hypothetical protein
MRGLFTLIGGLALVAVGGAANTGDDAAASTDPVNGAGGTTPGATGSGTASAGGDAAGADGTSANPASCAITASETVAPLATAAIDGEQILTIDAHAMSKTSWAESGNEAVVLEVLHAGQRVGHLVLHQGQDPFTYAMHVGALAKGDALTVRVSPLTAAKATK